jgi:hypothetical protein
MDEEEGGGGGDGCDSDFGFGEEGQAEEKAGKEVERGGAAAKGGVEGKEREEGEEETADEFVGVRGEEVVVAHFGVAVEGEEEDEGGDGDGGGERGGDAAEEGAEGEEGGEPEDEVEGEKGVDGGASQNGEEGGVGIDGERAEVVGDVAVEDVAAGDAPREIEFAGEVDESVGPREPGEMEHGGREDGVEEEFEGEEKTRIVREKVFHGGESGGRRVATTR